MARRVNNTLIYICIACVGLWFLIFFRNRGHHDISGFYPAIDVNSDFGSKHLIVAAMNGDDTTWIERRLPTWSSSVYLADHTKARLTVPRNKGREAMVYLTYLIDNYNSLPSIMLFIHGQQFQWHNDDPNYDTATVISRVQLPYIISEGYVNLRCVWELGCPSEIHVKRPIMTNPSEVHYREGYQQLFPQRQLPEVVGATCCAQFGLTKEQAREVPLEDYVRIRKWLLETPFEDKVSGRIMEYSWHVLFGRESVHCPDAKSCYCKLFGLCDLKKCTAGWCEHRYYLPPQSNKPPWWKEDPAIAGALPPVY